MSNKDVTIEIESGDLQYKLIHTLNAYDDDPTNDIVTIVPISASNTLPYSFEKGHTHALTVVGRGRVGAKFKLKIEEIAVSGTVKVNSNGDLVDTFVFNVY